MDEGEAVRARWYVDEELLAVLAEASGGRLRFEQDAERLTHQRPGGGVAPVFVAASDIRSLMAVLVLVADEPLPEGGTLAHGVRLLLDVLDRHPVSTLLGWRHLRAAALTPDVGPTGDDWWTSTA